MEGRGVHTCYKNAEKKENPDISLQQRESEGHDGARWDA